jgi:hypothetical protein
MYLESQKPEESTADSASGLDPTSERQRPNSKRVAIVANLWHPSHV